MDLQVGAAVSVRGALCHVRYLGQTRFAEGHWVGVEFATACGRNDGSVEGERYFECKPRHGLFVRAENVSPASAAHAQVESDVPAAQVSGAWTAMEGAMEREALQAGRTGERVLRHLEQLHPGGKPAPSATSADALMSP